MSNVKRVFRDEARIFTTIIAIGDDLHGIPRKQRPELFRRNNPPFDAVLAAAESHPEPMVRQHAVVLRHAKALWAAAMSDIENFKETAKANKAKQDAREASRDAVRSGNFWEGFDEMCEADTDRAKEAERRYLRGEVRELIG